MGPTFRRSRSKIWAAPELGYQETKTTALLQDELRAAGFAIEAGVAGMPTAFVARAGTTDGPVIAILAEMDALPGMSQEAAPDRTPIAGQIAGHACGHHLFGTGAVAAAIAIKSWLEASGTKGQIRVYGTPAEEGGGGKVYMVRAGLFKDVDATLYWHPGDRKQRLPGPQSRDHQREIPVSWAVRPCRRRTRSRTLRARRRRGHELHGQLHARTHAAGRPHPLRHHQWRHGAQHRSGVRRSSYYVVRHPDPPGHRRIVRARRQGGGRRGARHRNDDGLRADRRHLQHLPNDTLGRVMDASLRRVGGPSWTPAEMQFAEQLRKNLPGPRLPALASAGEIRKYQYDGQKYSSTDSAT